MPKRIILDGEVDRAVMRYLAAGITPNQVLEYTIRRERSGEKVIILTCHFEDPTPAPQLDKEE